MVIQLKSVVLSKLPKLRKAMTKIRRLAFQDVGEYWHRELLPDHFKPSARTEFDHLPRDKEWIEMCYDGSKSFDCTTYKWKIIRLKEKEMWIEEYLNDILWSERKLKPL